MNTVILGADNPLGSELVTHLQSRELRCVSIAGADPALDKPHLLMNAFSVHQPGFVVNLQCRELLSTDVAEDHKRALRSLKNITRACRAVDAVMIHVSDCDVFAGQRIGSYREHDKPDGHGDRVKRLIKAENYARRRVPRHIMLRPGTMISPTGDNVFTRIMRSLERGDRLTFGPGSVCITPASDVARVIAALIQQLECGASPWGIYHYCSEEATNLFAFTEVAVALASQYGKIDADSVQIELKEDGTENLVLSCKQILSAFGIRQRKWRTNLPSIVAEYCRQ